MASFLRIAGMKPFRLLSRGGSQRKGRGDETCSLSDNPAKAHLARERLQPPRSGVCGIPQGRSLYVPTRPEVTAGFARASTSPAIPGRGNAGQHWR